MALTKVWHAASGQWLPVAVVDAEQWHWRDTAPATDADWLAIGRKGDFLLLASGDVYERTETPPTMWTLRGNLKGADGADGEDGHLWWISTTQPDLSWADFWLNPDTGDLHEHKTNFIDSTVSWGLRGNLKGPQGDPGVPGPEGPTGPPGPANTLAIGTVTTAPTGNPADADITGAAPNQTLDLVLPRGEKGDQGDPGAAGETGPPGPANSLAIGTVTTAPTGNPADADITGAPPSQVLDLVLPRGEKGDQGDPGTTGEPGPANSLAIGTVTTGAEGTAAQAQVTGTPPSQTLSLTIPRGYTGPAGLNWRGAWASGASYLVRDAVRYQGGTWRALREIGTSVTPPPNAVSDWEPVAVGQMPMQANPPVTGDVGALWYDTDEVSPPSGGGGDGLQESDLVGMVIEATTATQTPWSVQGASGQTADLFRWLDSALSVLAAVNAQGQFLEGARRVTPLTSRLTTAATSTSTTYASSGLSVALTAGRVYKIQVRGQYRTAATTTGIGLQIGGSGGLTATGIRYQTKIFGLTATTYTVQAQSALNAAAAPSTGVAAANTDYPFEIDGLIRVNVGGTLTLDFRSEVAGQTVTIQPDSFLYLREVA